VAEGKREIDELRQDIAKLDAQLLVALDKRARTARRLREVRKDQPPSIPLTDHAAIRALVARSNGDMPQESLRDIFREIFAACLALELPVKVAYVGPEGGSGHAAVRGRFGRSSSLVGAEGTQAALDEVTRRRAEFAVVPFETAAEGPVQSSILALMASDLRIVEVLDATFDLHLMNRTGNSADVEKIYATAADHALCERFLAGQTPRPSVLDVKTPLMACQLAVEDHARVWRRDAPTQVCSTPVNGFLRCLCPIWANLGKPPQGAAVFPGRDPVPPRLFISLAEIRVVHPAPLKTAELARVPGVRIPSPPPTYAAFFLRLLIPRFRSSLGCSPRRSSPVHCSRRR